MPIFCLMIAVENPTTKAIHIVQRDYQLDSVSWALRNEVKNSFKFLARESMPCLSKYTRHTVQQDDKLCHIQVSKRPVAAYAFVDEAYPQRIIFAFLNKVLDVFFDKVGEKWQSYSEDINLSIKEITKLFDEYQKPTNVDKLEKAIEEVDKTKVVLHESVKKLLERQGELDDLVAKSKDLSEASKQFYKNSKKMDKRCCQLI